MLHKMKLPLRWSYWLLHNLRGIIFIIYLMNSHCWEWCTWISIEVYAFLLWVFCTYLWRDKLRIPKPIFLIYLLYFLLIFVGLFLWCNLFQCWWLPLSDMDIIRPWSIHRLILCFCFNILSFDLFSLRLWSK